MSGKAIGLTVAIALLLIVLCGGGGAAFWYFKYGPGALAADVGPLPGRALALPADTALAAGFDAKALFASTAYKQLSSGDTPAPAPAQGVSPEEAEETRKKVREGLEQGLKEAEDKLGIRFDRDLERLVVGVWNVGAEKPEVALVALGHFDRAKIGKALAASLKENGGSLSPKTVAGIEVQVLSEHDKPKAALAFLDDATLVVGTPDGVETVVKNHTAHARPLESNASMLGLLKGLDAASGYWVVLDEALTTRAQKEAGSNAPPGMVPRTLTLAGKFDGAMQLAAELADEASAKNLAEMIQGGLGMARMQISQNPEAQKLPGLNELLDGIKVAAQGKRVSLSIPAGAPGMASAAAGLAMPSLLSARQSANEAAPLGSEVTQPAVEPSELARPDATQPEVTQPEVTQPEVTQPAATPRPAPRPTPRPVARATPRATAPTSAPPQREVDDEPAPARQAGPVRVGGNIPEPRKIKNVSPNYPAMAKQARVQGIVILECTIDAQGRVSSVRVLRGVPLLDRAAVDAVEKWVYEPTLLNGVPTPVIMTVTVNFKLN